MKLEHVLYLVALITITGACTSNATPVPCSTEGVLDCQAHSDDGRMTLSLTNPNAETVNITRIQYGIRHTVTDPNSYGTYVDFSCKANESRALAAGESVDVTFTEDGCAFSANETYGLHISYWLPESERSYQLLTGEIN